LDSTQEQRGNRRHLWSGGTGLSGVHRTLSGAPRESRLRNSPASGTHRSRSAIIHRTVRCNSGAMAIRRQRLPATQLMRAQRAQKSGAPILAHRTRNSACPVCPGHPGGPTSQKLQRSESNGSDDVAGAPDMSGVHRTVRCAIEQTASQRPLLVVGAINTPNHPTIHCIQVFHLPTTTRALAFNSRHTKEIKSSPNSTQRPSD
jgi:hypothetical protein